MVQVGNEARLETSQPKNDDQAEPQRLATADLRAIVPEDLRRRATNMVVHAIMSTPAGIKIDRNKLTETIEGNFEILCDGTELDLVPILDALLRVPGVVEEDLYVGIMNLITLLAAMGLKALEPPMALNESERARLLADAAKRSDDARTAFESEQVRRTLTAFRRQKLGELLIKHGMIDRGQLGEALRAQAEHGGRLGTNLVELGHISESELTHFLSLQLDLPAVDPNEMNAVPIEAVQSISAEIAAKHQIVPLSVERSQMHLAMVDPANIEAIDEIAFITGKRVIPAIAPEFLLRYALEKYYGIKRAPRFVPDPKSLLFSGGHNASAGLDHSIIDLEAAPQVIVSNENDADPASEETVESTIADGAPVPAPNADLTGPALPEADDDGSMDMLESANTDLVNLPLVPIRMSIPIPPDLQSAEAWHSGQLEDTQDVGRTPEDLPLAELADATDENQVFGTLEKLLAEDFRHFALFETDGTSVSKWHPYMDSVRIHSGKRPSIPAHEHPVLGWVLSTGKPYSGPIAQPTSFVLGGDRDWLADALCTRPDSEVVCAPILRHGRVVALLAGSDPVGIFENEGIGSYQRIAFLTGSALEMVALRRAILNAATTIGR